MIFRRLREYCIFLRSLFHTTTRLLWGMWKLTKVPHPAITVFGGARTPLEGKHAAMARELTKILAADGFSIITGGGPGIMEAANQGAMDYLKEARIKETVHKKKAISAGVGLIHLNKERVNPYVQESVIMDHFFARKWLLVRYSVGFVLFPGGFGTMDELFEVVTLVQCNRMSSVPIILVDKQYWGPIIEWIEQRALPAGLISKEDTTIITAVDTVQEAVDVLRHWCTEVECSVFFSGNAKKD